MINWARRVEELSTKIVKYNRTRLLESRLEIIEIAKEYLDLRDLEKRARRAFLDSYFEPDKEKATIKMGEYLGLVREINTRTGAVPDLPEGDLNDR